MLSSDYMNAKELFSAAVRVIGLLSLQRGVYDLFYVLLFNLELSEVSVTAKAPNADLIFGLFYFFIGLYLLRGAPLIVNFAFPYKKTEIEEETIQTSAENIENQ